MRSTTGAPGVSNRMLPRDASAAATGGERRRAKKKARCGRLSYRMTRIYVYTRGESQDSAAAAPSQVYFDAPERN